ncbi:MAG: hypothetical protein AAGI91_05130 [Bacteroidota bacterium]
MMTYLFARQPLAATRLLALWCAAALALTGCGATNSTVNIEPGEQFVLGGGSGSAFRVQVQNLGPGPITVRSRSAGGEVSDLAVLEPDEQETVRFPARASALLSNASEFATQVAVRIWSVGRLGMGYDPVE